MILSDHKVCNATQKYWTELVTTSNRIVATCAKNDVKIQLAACLVTF